MQKTQIPNFAINALQNTKETIDSLINNSFGINYYLLPKIVINDFKFKPDFSEDINKYRQIYNELIGSRIINDYKNPSPCVYIFEIVSCSQNNETILKKYLSFQNEKSRASSSIKKNVNFVANDSKILYVGKSEKPIEGRMSVHFGYYEKGIAGLQLVHWAMDMQDELLKLNLVINVHILNLTKEYESLEFIEKLFFYKLNPLIGNR